MTDLWQLYLLVGLRSSKLRSRDETPSTYSSMRKTWIQLVLGDWNQIGELLRLSLCLVGNVVNVLLIAYNRMHISCMYRVMF